MAASKKTTYASVRANLQKKANFFKTLANQTTGPASSHRPSPSQLNSFSKWVEKGAVIQNVSQNQLNRWAGSASKRARPMPTACAPCPGNTAIRVIIADLSL